VSEHREEVKVAVVVASSDGYRDLWRPFFTLFFRYWPDCPHPIYLATNEARFDDPRVRTVMSGPDHDWSSSFRRVLEQIDEPWLIVLLEDYLFTGPVETERLRGLVAYAADSQATCLRLAPVPGVADGRPDRPDVGEIVPGTPYRISLQAAIWNRDGLLALLRDGESAWELELVGSQRTITDPNPYLSVLNGARWPVPYFCTAVVRGLWLRNALAICRREGVPVDLSSREKEPMLAFLRRRARLGRFRHRS